MKLIPWLMEGDISIQYQVYRDLLDQERNDLLERISQEGYCNRFLKYQQKDGHWGGGYYTKKWISTHYTLMTLTRLQMLDIPAVRKAIDNILKEHTVENKQNHFNLEWTIKDICMDGMLLYAFTHFHTEEPRLKLIIDYILTQQLPDGGYNCNYNKPGHHTHHSSLHSTISLIEGLTSYIKRGYSYRREEVLRQRNEAVEFVLMHRLYKSDKTGEIIKKSFTMLSFPPRWKYDILRALDALREAEVPYDERIGDALALLMEKRRKDGTWPVQQKYTGDVYFDMETTGSSSRFNTLRALRVLKFYKPEAYKKLEL